ncbi:MAG: hypothetical protein SNH27_10785 [Rikenellaceae bacterium]
MRRLHETKVIVLTWRGLVSGWKQSKKSVVTTNGEKSAEYFTPMIPSIRSWIPLVHGMIPPP